MRNHHGKGVQRANEGAPVAIIRVRLDTKSPVKPGLTHKLNAVLGI